jgi:hypothetical protein
MEAIGINACIDKVDRDISSVNMVVKMSTLSTTNKVEELINFKLSDSPCKIGCDIKSIKNT